MKIDTIIKYHIWINLILTFFVTVNFLLFLFKDSFLPYFWTYGLHSILYDSLGLLSQITYLGAFLLFILGILTLFFYLTRKVNFKLIILSFLNVISLPIVLFSTLLNVMPFIQFYPALIFFYVIYLKKKMPPLIITESSKKAYNAKLLVAGILIIILIALIIFFFPRDCGHWTTARGPSVTEKFCDCMGIKYNPNVEGGAYITCFGIPTSYHCYIAGKEETEIPCA